MRIRTRLFSFYLVVVLLVALLGWASYQVSRAVEAQYHSFAEETLPVVQAIHDVRFHSIQVIASAAEVMLLQSSGRQPATAEPRALDDEMDELRQVTGALQTAFDRYQQLVERYFPEERGLLEALRTQIDSLVELTQPLLWPAFEQAPSRRDLFALKSELEAVEASLLAVIDRVFEHEEAESEERHEALDDRVGDLVWVLLLGGVTVLLSALAMAWGTGRYVTQPIDYLLSAFRALGGGGKLPTAQPLADGELGGLLRAFEQMRSQLQQRELSLQFNRDYLDRVLESMEDMLLTLSEAGMIQRLNRAACEQLGYERVDLLGQSIERVADSRICEALKDESLSGHFEAELHHRDGHRVHVLVSLNAVAPVGSEEAGIVLVASNISERKVAEEKVHRLAFYDPLSGLPNRTLFYDRLTQAVKFALRQRQQLAVLFLDVDNFKQVNDSLGHDVGDEMIRAVSERLTQAVREVDIELRGGEEVLRPVVSRYGGDEFLILLPHVARPEAAELVAERLLQAFEAPLVLGVHKLHSSISIGIALAPEDGADARLLVQNADTALYSAKAEGKKRYRRFVSEMNSSVLRRVEIETCLRRGLENAEFELYYQPQLDLETGELLGVEALLRWNHPQWGLVPPLEFIPVAERSGLIAPLGNWVLEQACLQWQRWQAAGWEVGKMSINLSALQLNDGRFAETLARALAAYAMPPSALVLELTESVLMSDVPEAGRQIEALRECGVGMAVDDFGTGYSSLSYLKSFPLNYVKIDRSFIRDLESSDSDLELVRTIIAMARGLGMWLIAEGVETPGQLHLLKQLDCHALQGYLLSRPLPAAELERTLLTPEGQQSHKGLELCRVALS